MQPGELKQLWTELTALPETTEENVAAHVALAQRLQDVLYQEAVDFFWDEAGSRPVGHMEPWNERHVFNELLAAGEAGKAYARLNRFLRCSPAIFSGTTPMEPWATSLPIGHRMNSFGRLQRKTVRLFWILETRCPR